MTRKSSIPVASAAVLALALSGCGHFARTLPAGQDAEALMTPTAEQSAAEQLLREGDKLDIRVFGEPELTSDKYVIDDSGHIQLPLAGEMTASGKTPRQLRDDITQALGGRYIRNPQVAVNVVERTSSTFSIEGQVTDPGVYETNRSTTLLSAIARAKSPTKTAKLDEVVIFRTIDGKRFGARFDIREIRAGRQADPHIMAGDTIVVGFDQLKGAYRDFIQAAPLFYIFTQFKL